MKSSYQSRALKTWLALAPYVKNCRTSERYFQAVKKFNEEHHRNVKFAHGATRVCFICADYVIKKDYGCNQIDFGGCADELRKYHEAQDNGYEYLFAPIEKLTRNIYVMPRVKTQEWWEEDTYLEKFFNDLTDDERDYIEENIRDIHGGNVGLYKRKAVLIDYACG